MSDFPLLLAKEMGVSRRTVQRRCEAGNVPGAYRTKGGHWRLRKPTRIKRWCRYDGKIVDFVMRYTANGDYRRPIPDAVLAKQIIETAARCLAGPAPLRVAEAGRTKERLKWAEMVLDREAADGMEELTASKDFNEAVDFSFVAKGICDDDKFPPGLKDIATQERSRAIRQHFKDLEERDPDKFRSLIGERDPKTGNIRPTPILDMIHSRAYEAVKERHGMLIVAAEKLRLNMRQVTPKLLAYELGISVATLYRRYGKEHVKRAREGRSDYALPSDATPIPQTTRESRRDEQIRQRAARFEIRS